MHIKDTLRDLVGVQDSQRGWPLRAAMQRIAEDGYGVIILMHPHEEPRELVEAIGTLKGGGYRPAAGVLRTYGIGAQILRDLGISRMRVLSAPRHLLGLSGFDLEVVEYVD